MLPKNIFQKHHHIGIDLDETLAQTVFDGIQALHGMNRMKFIQSIEDVTSFHWTDFPECDMTNAEIMDFWRRHNMKRVLPLENAILGVAELSRRNKILHLITARNEHDHRSDIERWLDLYFPQIHPTRIHFSNYFSKHNHPKTILCQSLKVTLMIDDGLHNALDLAEQGIESILIDQPWNRHESATQPLIHRVKNWSEIIDNLW